MVFTSLEIQSVAIHTTGQSSSYVTGTPTANSDWFDHKQFN